jgi:hypothetical protein
MHQILWHLGIFPYLFLFQTRFSITKSIEQPRHDFVDVIVFGGITHDIS